MEGREKGRSVTRLGGRFGICLVLDNGDGDDSGGGRRKRRRRVVVTVVGS